MIIGDVKLLWMGPQPVLHIGVGFQDAGQGQFPLFAVKLRRLEDTPLNSCKEYGMNIFREIIE